MLILISTIPQLLSSQIVPDQLSLVNLLYANYFRASRETTKGILSLSISLLLLCWLATITKAQENIDAHNSVEKDKCTTVLELGKAIERELVGGEAHCYEISLLSDQLLNVVVDQRGIDVVVTLFGRGEKLVEVDSPNGSKGAETVLWVAETSGRYRLEVRSLSKDAPAGRYEARIEQLKQASAQDREQHIAQKLFIEAKELYKQNKKESYEKAIELYLKSLPHWRTGLNRNGEAQTLYNIGDIYRLLSDNKQALDYYCEALPLLRMIADHNGEAITLNDIGFVYDSLSESQKALGYYQQALQIAQETDNRRIQATVLNNTGLAYDSLGESQKALDYYNQSLPLRRELADRSGEATTLNNIGSVYDSLGEVQKALGYYQQALQIAQETDNRRIQATVLNNIGLVYRLLGETQIALGYYNQVLEIVQKTGNRAVQANALHNIGAVYNLLGDQQQALDYYTKALSLRRAVGDRNSEARTLYNIGDAYYSLDDKHQALDNYNQALALFQTIGNKKGEAVVRFGIARIKRDSGELNEAYDNSEKALGIIESLRAKIDIKELRTSYFISVQSRYEFHIDLLMQLHQQKPDAGYDRLAFEASERGRARILLEALTEAKVDIRQGINAQLLEQERILQQQLNAKAGYNLKLLSNNRSTKEQIAVAEKELTRLNEELEKIEVQIRKDNPQYAALKYLQPLNLSEIQRQVLDADTLLLEYSLGNEQSYLWAVTETSITSYRLPKRADIEKAALDVYQLLTAWEKRDFETTAVVRERIKKAKAEYPVAATVLSQMLLGQVTKLLGKKRLLIINEGLLQYVPLVALPVPKQSTPQVTKTKQPFTPLVVEHEIVNLPSASTLALQRQTIAERKPSGKTLALFAHPVFSVEDQRVKAIVSKNGIKSDKLSTALADIPINGLDAVPETEQMARDILALVPSAASKLAIGFDANLVEATSPQLGQYKIVHYATHGFLNTNPELSGILLSLINKEGESQKGFLSAPAIFNLNLPIELVVLSACQTGLALDPLESSDQRALREKLGKVKDQGLTGLARGFMYAGAMRVMVSLWNIRAKATRELMVRFYDAMLHSQKLSPAAALRAAQIAMWKNSRWQSPYYWAAFVIIGEYANMPK
ncbi:MAG: tetratricopeptide repeat protein [Acidobacteriota bacterium]